MNIFQSPFWNTILQILRDPIFGLIFGVILTILAARAVRRVIKVIFYLGILVVFVWLVTHNKSFADVCITIVSAVFNILLVLIEVLAAISIVAIISVLIMFVIAKPSSHRRRPSSYMSPMSWDDVLSSGVTTETRLPTSKEAEIRKQLAAGRHVSVEQAKTLLIEKYRRIALLMQDFESISQSLDDAIDEDRPLKTLTSLAHTYFSGLSAHMARIRKIHKACNSEIVDLVSLLPAIFVDPDVQMLKYMARAKTFLPDKDEWQNMDAPIPYVLLRLFCLHRNWKEVGTILYKSHCYAAQLSEYIEAL
jgi:hypothetical protein